MGTTLMPYLTFDGTAGDAMKFYQSVLGGELTMQTFGEAKMANKPEDSNRIIHATLKNDALTFMASDSQPGEPIKMGDNFSMSISGEDSSKLMAFFNKLSVGGTVDMPLAKQFWGDTFGTLRDKFGVRWMVNINSQPQT
jgi:PhnB protein